MQKVAPLTRPFYVTGECIPKLFYYHTTKCPDALIGIRFFNERKAIVQGLNIASDVTKTQVVERKDLLLMRSKRIAHTILLLQFFGLDLFHLLEDCLGNPGRILQMHIIRT